MKKFALAALAAGLFCAAAPAAFSQVTIRAGERGITVRSNDDDRDRRRGDRGIIRRDRDNDGFRDRRRDRTVFVAPRPRCRTVITRIEGRRGTVIKRERVCGRDDD